MKFNRFLLHLFKLFIIISLLIDSNICQKKKKNRERDRDYESESEGPQRRRGSQTDDVIVIVDNEPDVRQGRGRGPDGRGPPGQRGRQLPPGQAKKHNNRDTTIVVIDENRNQGRNKPKNKNKPNRNNNENRGNSDDFEDIGFDRPQTQTSRPTYNEPQNNRQTSRPPRHTPRPTPVVESPEEVIDIPLSEWRSLERLRHNWENTAHTKSELSKKFIFWLEKDADYQRHDACLTPDNSLGYCHFVQHCPIPDVIRSFEKFLSFACFIHNRYIGICCPNDYFDIDEDPARSKPAKSTVTTRRPSNQQRPPKTKRPNSNGSDGSDYENGICGVSENTRIIGGALADPKDWLWMAALIIKSDTKPFCGGALITNQHILTAAHCLPDRTPDDILVRLGAYDFSASADPEAQDFAVDYFKIHPNYNRFTNENDLAIIKLRSKTSFTDSIKPICLPQRNRDYAGKLSIVTGWGHTSFGGKGSPQLRQVTLPVWNNTYCQTPFSVTISDNMLCAGNKQGGKDSCQGDSGGPLMLQGPNKRWMIIGVVSWGIKCGQPNYPGVYTRISKYIDWIKTHSKDSYK